MIINSSKQLLINLIFVAKEIFNVKWILDYLRYEFIYWRSWMPLTLTAVLTVLGQLNNIFFKNNQKKSGLHKTHSVIERQGVREETEYLFFRLESL